MPITHTVCPYLVPHMQKKKFKEQQTTSLLMTPRSKKEGPPGPTTTTILYVPHCRHIFRVEKLKEEQKLRGKIVALLRSRFSRKYGEEEIQYFL